MLGYGSVNPECYPLEPPESKYNGTCTYPECDGFCFERKPASRKNEVVKKMSKHEHSEVQGRKLEVGGQSDKNYRAKKYAHSGERM